jgi:hypothetical protein
LVVLVAACGGAPGKSLPATAPANPKTLTEQMLPLLPDGMQIVVELDLARVRANPVVGGVAGAALDRMGADTHVPGLPVTAAGSPLALADALVLAAYGVGTAQAATIVMLHTTRDVPGGVRVAPEVVALGPDEWTGQVTARAAIASANAMQLAMPPWLGKLREHAMPSGAPGATLRIVARLPFDARVALARQAGIEFAPAQLSLWADIADDFALVVDADAIDPGDRAAKDSARRLAGSVRGLLGTVAADPAIRALGLPPSLAEARVITQGTWVRAVIAVGPQHLARVVERARAMLAPS